MTGLPNAAHAPLQPLSATAIAPRHAHVSTHPFQGNQIALHVQQRVGWLMQQNHAEAGELLYLGQSKWIFGQDC